MTGTARPVAKGGAPSSALREGCPVPLMEAYDAALLDLDGVVYVGREAVPHAASALAAARARGLKLGFVTNNAARTPKTVADHLTELGIPAAADEVITSAQAAARVVAELVPAGSAVLVVGGEGLEEALAEIGLRAVRTLAEDPRAVVQGYHPTVDWQALAEASYAVARGLPWVASNLDRTIPTPQGIAPGNGTLVGVVQAATGVRPMQVAGKPELPLHQESIRRTGARRPLVVGDRLDTDILGANNAGTPSLLLLSGVTSPEELLAADARHRPTYLAEDLRGLLVPHPAVAETSTGWACQGWTARVSDRVVELAGAGDPIDGLRAVCVAGWSMESPAQAREALRRLSF